MKHEIPFDQITGIRKLLIPLLVVALIMSGCGVSGSAETTVPTQPPVTVPEETTEPEETAMPTEPVIVVTDWLTMNGEHGMIEYPEAFFPDFLAEVESVYRNREGTSAHISYIGLEEGCEQITDQGLWMYRMEFRVDGPNPYEFDRLFLYYREEMYGPWKQLEVYNDGWIAQYVDEGRIPAELVEQYGSQSIAAAVWHWQEYSRDISHVNDITRLLDWMQSNGGITIEHNGNGYACVLDGWEAGQWERIKIYQNLTERSAYYGDADYVKIMDASGNYICVYNCGDLVLELCQAGKEPLWYTCKVPQYDNDWFRTYQMIYYGEGIDFDGWTCYADSYQEALDVFGEMIADRHLKVEPESPYYALEYEILREPMVGSEGMIGFVAEDGTWAEGSVYYAIRQPELSFDAYGNVNEGTGEWEGWLMINQWYKVVYLGDGLWGCKTA